MRISHCPQAGFAEDFDTSPCDTGLPRSGARAAVNLKTIFLPANA